MGDTRLVQEPGWFPNKPCKTLRILLFLSGCCSGTEVFKQLCYVKAGGSEMQKRNFFRRKI
jgi:hypothetical protein